MFSDADLKNMFYIIVPISYFYNILYRNIWWLISRYTPNQLMTNLTQGLNFVLIIYLDLNRWSKWGTTL